MTARRPRWIPWVVVGIIVALCAGAAAFLVPPALEYRAAEQRYERALAEHGRASEDRDAARSRWDAAHSDVAGTLELADAATPEAALPYLDEARVGDVRELAELIRGAADDATAPETPDADASKPETTDELDAAADELEAQADAASAAAERYDDATKIVAERAPELAAAVDALRASIPDRAEQLEEANVSATAQSRIRLHYAADAAATGEESVEYYVTAYAEAAAAVEQSQRDELAEKDQGDGLIDVRLEIEEFVRSITGGVRVDFDWAPVVNGLGEGDSAGGRVTWQYLDGGSATMELSNSVAAHWPDPRYESLVAHESGHVITAKCQDMLTDAFDGDAELMATAWAIGMGYDDPWGNGVNFYYNGVAPAQDLVDETTSCR
ncbi:hypothetical protein [Microbacterium nanhaiense]|uniref:hypothetical protein n=1 Tax=Microbacterium nanhaiense TaxID=1301026 RepID=UPI00166D77BD|nr:hypothetical protein [Microbacterium nanhaiense]